MNRIEVEAKRIEQLYNQKRQESKLDFEDEANEIISLVLQMFEAGTKEDDMLINEVTIEFGVNCKFDFSFKSNLRTYRKSKVSNYKHISKVAEKICNIKFNSKSLKKAKDLYLEMAEKIPSYYISKVDFFGETEEISGVTFGIGKIE